jgi:hypothetical protein
MFWPLENLEKVLRWYRNWNQPQNVSAFFLVAEVPPGPPFPVATHGKNVCGLVWCSIAPQDETDAALRIARSLCPPLVDLVSSMPYPALQSLFDALMPPGLQWYWKGDYVKEIPDEAIEIHKRFASVPTSLSTMHIYPIDGAVHRKRSGDTAWPIRDARWSLIVAGKRVPFLMSFERLIKGSFCAKGVDPLPENRKLITEWSRNYWQALHPYSIGCAYAILLFSLSYSFSLKHCRYINFLMDEGHDRVKSTYGENYERLRKIKSKYDPENFFHINQNIKPA